MIKLSILKSRCVIACTVALLLNGCVSLSSNERSQDDALSPLKEQQKIESPSVNPKKKLGPERLSGFQREMLAAVNAARIGGYTCGQQIMPAVAPVVWDEQLQQAALAHSQNMAQEDYFNHQDKSGYRVGERVYATGYNWRAAGENIAAGQLEASVVIEGWLGSKGHCLNIMDGDYTQMGMASFSNQNSYYGIYWTQVLAAPF